MPLDMVGSALNYGWVAIMGAATRTFYEWKLRRVGFLKLVVYFLGNSLFALLVGSYAAAVFLIEFPSHEHFTYPLVWFFSAVGINVISGVMSIKWRQVFTKRLGGDE